VYQMALSTLHGAWRRYLDALRDYPIRTKSITSAVLAAFSDLVAQRLVGTPLGKINWLSTRNQVLFAFFIRAPAIHYWFDFLERTLRRLGLAPDPDKEREAGGSPLWLVLLKWPAISSSSAHYCSWSTSMVWVP